MMTIRFHGVRGSIASPGPDTSGVGGNTSCVELRCGEQLFILDAGTGLRRLGDSLPLAQPVEATLLLSHHHWDHIQGLPFFTPIYLPSTRLTVLGPKPERCSLRDVLAQQMAAPVFPVRLEELASRLVTRELGAGQPFEHGAVRVTAAKLNHPGGVFAYRVEHGGHAVVYATDTEHYACPDPALIRLAAGADVLIYDAQYTREEYAGESGPPRVGWGHSTWEEGVKVAQAAGVGQLVLFHHDPRRTDAGVAALERAAQARFGATVAAREGLSLTLGAGVAASPGVAATAEDDAPESLRGRAPTVEDDPAPASRRGRAGHAVVTARSPEAAPPSVR